MEWKRSRDLVPYDAAMAFMAERTAAIRAGEAPECIWFLEHPPLYTVGVQRRAVQEDCHAPLPYPLYESPRGGRMTYHGPGQLVIYVMVDLAARGGDLRAFMRRLLEWLQAGVRAVGAETEVSLAPLGLWVPGDEVRLKLASAGLRVQKWVTSHGVALNIHPDLTAFQAIRPCGLEEARYQVTSLQALGYMVTRADIETRLLEAQNFLANETRVL